MKDREGSGIIVPAGMAPGRNRRYGILPVTSEPPARASVPGGQRGAARSGSDPIHDDDSLHTLAVSAAP